MPQPRPGLVWQTNEVAVQTIRQSRERRAAAFGCRSGRRSPDGGFDTEVRIPEPTTLCWISGEDVERFTEELQALITKYAI